MRSQNVYGFLLTFACLFIIFTIIPFTTGGSEKSRRVTRSISDIDNEVRYGVICDAGSSGTRLFVYTLKPIDGGLTDIDTLIHESEPVVKKVTPGLSTFADEPEKVTEYLTPLIRFAEEHIPSRLISETDLMIFATAGMRLLPEKKKDAIIENLRSGLRRVTSLRIDDSNIRVIDGAWEGIYSWIAVNYILGRFNEEEEKKVGMIDMGGASVQIAFEVPKDNAFDDGSVYEINLKNGPNNNYKYTLYSTTFLGYGANEGLKKYEESLARSGLSEDSCSPRGLDKLIGANSVNGTGEWETCLARVSSLIGDKSKPSCLKPTCFLRNMPAPTVDLSNMQLYGFSEYWYTTSNFGAEGTYNYNTFTEKVKNYCRKNWTEIQEAFKRKEYPNAEYGRLSTNCFKAAWVTSVLHEGFNVDKTKNLFQSVLKIAGEEMQWALGAMLYHSRNLDFGVDFEEELEQSSRQISNFFSFLVILIVILAVVFYRKLQSDSTNKKYYYLRTDSKPDFLNV